MTGERLLPCPWCGDLPYHNVNGDPTGFGATVVCVQERCPANPRVHAGSNTLAHAEKWAAKQWNTRSLPAAIDRVIAEVEAKGVTFWRKVLANRYKIESDYKAADGSLVERHVVVSILNALRAEHSATQPDQAPSPPRGTGDG